MDGGIEKFLSIANLCDSVHTNETIAEIKEWYESTQNPSIVELLNESVIACNKTTFHSPFLKLLASLTISKQSAHAVYHFLCLMNEVSTLYSWKNFVKTISDCYFKFHDSKYLTHPEIVVLVDILHLITSLATYEDSFRQLFCDNSIIEIIAAFTVENITHELKYHLIITLKALANSNETTPKIWKFCFQHKVIDMIIFEGTLKPSSECILSEAIVRLISTISKFNDPEKLIQMKKYFLFIYNSIFMKSYKENHIIRSNQWKLARKCLELFNFIIQQYDQFFFEELDSKKLFNLILHFTSMAIKTDACFNMYPSEMNSCLLQCLVFIEHSIQLKTESNRINSGMSILPNIVHMLMCSTCCD